VSAFHCGHVKHCRPSVLHGGSRYEQIPNIFVSLSVRYSVIANSRRSCWSYLFSALLITYYILKTSLLLDKPRDGCGGIARVCQW